MFLILGIDGQIALIDGIIFVLEYKTSEQKFTREARTQVWDYALDLKNFHEQSAERILIPILVVSPTL